MKVTLPDFHRAGVLVVGDVMGLVYILQALEDQALFFRQVTANGGAGRR